MSSSGETTDTAYQALEEGPSTTTQSERHSFVAAAATEAMEKDTVSELTRTNLKHHNVPTTPASSALPMSSVLRRALNNSVHSTAEWLEQMSTTSKSEFGDIDPSGDDDEMGMGEYDHDKIFEEEEQQYDASFPRSHGGGSHRGLSSPVATSFIQIPVTPLVHSTSLPPPPSGSSPQRRKVLVSRLKVILDDQTLFSMYKRLMYIAILVNVVLLICLCSGKYKAAEGKAPLIAVVNVFLCVLFRNELFFRIVYWATVKALANALVPVQIKWWVTSFLQSVGGLHSGTGMASVIWMIKAIYDMSGNEQLATDAMVVLAYLIMFVLSISCLGAFPVVRHLFHNTFEFSHRLAGWSSLLLLWGFVVLAGRHTQTLSLEMPRPRMRDVLEGMPEYWLAIGLSVLVVLPWLSVRRVRVEITTPSNHASLIRFPQPIRAGYLGRIARSPLGDWHAFGIISDNKFTHTMLTGAVGDFTKKLLRDKPEYLYTRTVRFAGLPYLIHMYQRVLLVATGSGLCPFMSFLLQDTYPDVYVIWVGKNLRQNFGDELLAGVEAYPADRRIVRDTAIHQRPNMLELTIATAKQHKIEVVIVTSNPVGTRDIVNGCRKAGVAAYGPIWDS